jgi:hypothetical protein
VGGSFPSTAAFNLDAVQIMAHAFDNCRETVPDAQDCAETESDGHPNDKGPSYSASTTRA